MARKGALQQIGEHRGGFVTAFIAVFLLSLLFLASVGATPNPIHPQVINEPVVAAAATPARPAGGSTPTATPSSPQMPVRIVAKDIKLDVSIANPVSTDIEVLDEGLMKGAVRYPTSAQLGVDGTVLLFGHSSYLPIVHNQAYKTFDGIQDLKTGAIVHVYSSNTDYQYSVVGVRVADATQDSIELDPIGKHLTLVTCDSFASKSHRFIVTANFVGAYSLTSN
jgi:LPXTG-site transpeptidase (sortase) family protein